MCAIYPEGAAGNIDITPGDDDSVFDGFAGNINTAEGAVSVIFDLDVNGETLSILEAQRNHPQSQIIPASPAIISNPSLWKKSSHLTIKVQLSSAGSAGVNGEVSGFVDNAADWLQTWTVTFNLRRPRHKRFYLFRFRTENL